VKKETTHPTTSKEKQEFAHGQSLEEHEELSTKLDGIFEKDSLSICLPGDPIAKMRHRDAKSGKYGRKRIRYDPQNEEKQTLKWKLKARMAGRQPLDGPVELYMLCVMKEPKNKKYDFPITKPDLDNLEKWIGDVGNKILWHDDSQIVANRTMKIYGTEPKTVIMARKIDASYLEAPKNFTY